MSGERGQGAGKTVHEWSRTGKKRILDKVGESTVAVVFVAVSLLWVLRSISLPIQEAAIAVLVYLPVYLVVSELTGRLRRRWLTAAVTAAQHGSLVVFLAFLWHLVGGLANPAFLMAFVPLALTVGVLYGWRWALAVSAFTVSAVALVALVESSELRWYVMRFGLPMGTLAARLPVVPARELFAGLDAGPASQFALLSIFAILITVTAATGDTLGHSFRSLQERFISTRALRHDSDSLLRAALLDATDPTALVDQDSGEFLLASRSFNRQMLVGDDDQSSRSLFDVLRFSERPSVQGLFLDGGRLPFCAYRVGEEARVAELTATPVARRNQRCVLVTIRDLTALADLKAMLDALDEPHLVLGPDDRVRYANEAARGLFNDVHPGANAADVLAGDGLPSAWWKAPGPSSADAGRALAARGYHADYLLSNDRVGALRLVRLRRTALLADPA